MRFYRFEIVIDKEPEDEGYLAYGCCSAQNILYGHGSSFSWDSQPRAAVPHRRGTC